MNIAFHTGKSAMIAQGKALDIYGNNIANINTVGYQTLRPDFADCIYETERRPEADWQTGHGTYIQKTDLMFSESFFNETDRPQDMAIAGEGFFAVQDRWGNINYTRDGAFALTQLDGTWYLVSSQGEYVLNYDKERIAVPFEEASKNDILATLNWEEISGRIGTFLSDAASERRVRYKFSGEVNDQTPARNENAAKTLTPSSTDPVTGASISTADGYFALKDDYGNILYSHDEQLSIQKKDGKWYLGSTSGDFLLDYNNQLIPITQYTVSSDAPILEKAANDPDSGEYTVMAEDGTISQAAVDNFIVVQEGTRWYLKSADDLYILNENDQKISATDISVGDYFNINWNSLTSSVGVFTFNEGELSTDDKTRYNITATAADDVVKNLGEDAFSQITFSNNEALYAVEGENGIRYTHNVKFDIMQGDDGNWYLSTPQGEYVLDYNNERIQVAEPAYTGNVDWKGVKDMVGVFAFPNPYGIDAIGSNRYLETDRSGEAVACRVLDEALGEWVYTMDKLSNALIASNVNLADQLVKLIETQRAYQLSSRVVTTSDELARISNNLR